jgi:hypothetical protein
MEGFASVLYPPRFLLGVERSFERYLAHTSADDDFRTSDDVVMANFLEARGVPRFIVGAKFNATILPHDKDKDGTQQTGGGHIGRYARVIARLREQGLFFLGGRAECS